jgi:hypothetical protein
MTPELLKTAILRAMRERDGLIQYRDDFPDEEHFLTDISIRLQQDVIDACVLRLLGVAIKVGKRQ